jgi:hypothetical protein
MTSPQPSGHQHQDLLGGPAPTLLAEDPATALLAAGQDPASVAAAHPTSSAAWAALAEAALSGTTPDAASTGKVIEGYAYARTGYHRGLDALRRAGWKGFGPVPWAHAPNQGFLRALHALGRAADLIGEQAEAARIQAFLADSDPTAAGHLS